MIKKYIEDKKPVTISINFEPEQFGCGFLFISNSKRYSNLADATEKVSEAELIITSNITTLDRSADYVLNYSVLIKKWGGKR